MKNFDNYLFRCSSLGNLMTNARGKETMGKTVETYLQKIFRESVFKRRKDISSKYLERGTTSEQSGLTLYSNHINKLLVKNEEFFKNDHICGTPDNVQGKVRDIKCPWDIFTFPLFATEPPDKNNEWQVRGYMELTGLKRAEVVYTLVDTPTKLIEAEIRKAEWQAGQIDLSSEERAEIYAYYTYDDIKPKNRIRVFEFEADPEKIEKLYSRIDECRAYMNELLKQINR